MRLSGENIAIPARYAGPDGSANGGYTCGLVAALVGAATVRVTLRLPPPLDLPGAVREGIVAAPWIAREVAPEIVWASIDCPGAYAAGYPDRGSVLLGQMTARIARLPGEGETCVVVGWSLGDDGRKRYAGTALLGADGSPCAVARQTWIAPRLKS